MSTNDLVLETLAEKIQRQDRFIAQLQADLALAQQASVDNMLDASARNWQSLRSVA